MSHGILQNIRLHATPRAAALAAVLALVSVAQAAGIGGTWDGDVTQSDNNETYPVQMELYGDVGSIAYPSLRCGGQLTLIRSSGTSHWYREHISFGGDHCIDGGTVQLSPSPFGDPTRWNWRWDGSGISARGVLRGSGAAAR
jgi:hypothetical protein